MKLPLDLYSPLVLHVTDANRSGHWYSKFLCVPAFGIPQRLEELLIPDEGWPLSVRGGISIRHSGDRDREKGMSMNYMLTIRGDSTGLSRLVTMKDGIHAGHAPVEARLWVCVRIQDRWVEVGCSCGSLRRASGERPFGDLLDDAWAALSSESVAV